MLPLNDTKQRRFALLIGNSEYVQPIQPVCGRPRWWVDVLKNAVADVEALAEKLGQPHIGFKVTILRNAKKDEIEECVRQWTQSLPEDAIALLDFSGHGRELRGEKYFVPIDYNESMHDCSDDDDAVVRKAKTNFVELQGVLKLLHRVLRRDGLMITFWDCCRENDLRDSKNILRGSRQFDPLIRGEKAFEDHLDQLSSPDDPGQIVVCASLPSCLAFDGSGENSHGPFATALLEVLQDTELLAKDILDSSVKQHIKDTIRKITDGNQVPEFFERTEQTFKFLEQADSDGAPPGSTAGPFSFSGSGPTKGTAQPLPKRPESKGRLQVEVSQINKKTQDLVKADGSQLDRPDDAPWPFTILFVGVDNGEKTDPDLHLKREFERIEQAFREQAFREARVSKDGSSPVLIKWLRFSKWSEVMIEIRRVAPTILHFGCHSQKGKGLELFRQVVDPHDMLDSIRSWNESVSEQSPPQPKIRIIVLNACDSEDHASVLSEGVDFAIGHRTPVVDENASDFSGIFYDALFGCTSLMGSFNQAKSCSKGYRLFSPERDPRQFYLVPPGMRRGKTSMSSQHDAGEGSSSGAKRQKLDQAVWKQSELPLQVSSEGVTSSIGIIDKRLHDGEGGSRADSKAGDDVAAKKQRLQEPHAGGGGGGDGQGSGCCAASLDSTKQTFPYHVFISHAWDKDDEGRNNHERATRLNAGLQRLGMETWFDQEQLQGNNYKRIAEGIRGSAVVLICVTRRYMEKVEEEAGNKCKREFEFAAERRTDLFMLPVVMEECMTDASEWGDSLGLVLGRHVCHKLTSDVDDEFDKAVSEIAAAVRTKIDERLLPDLQQATSRKVQDAVSSREPSPTPSDQSGTSTAPQSPNQEVALVYIESTVSAFRDDMKKFMQDFLHQRRLCELLLVAFMRDKVATSCDAEIAENLVAWQEKCDDPDANLVISFNKIMLSIKPSILKEQLSYEFSDGNKKNHTSVFVIDWMVQHSPWALIKAKKDEWIEEVVRDFDPNNADIAEDFLERAEKFLQKTVKGEKWGIKILGKVIETNSYVAFFRMKALAALLLREYCSQQKILHEQQKKQNATQENDDQKRQCSLPLAISLIVSSSNWHVSFSKGKGPSSACVSEMAWHLQRIACLPAKTLETNEYSFSQLESVKCEPLYNLILKKMPVFMPRGARVRPINAERETRVRDIYADETARSVIERYLEGVRAAWGSYIDSASGEERRIDGQAVSLLLLKSKCFDDICDSDDRAKQEDMICPISQKIMRDPVKCSDGLTYERRSIEEWAKRSKTGVYHQPLEFEQQGDACKLCCQPNKEILEKIKQFKEEKRKELEDLKQRAEGEEEKRILRSRLGYTWRDGDSKGREQEGLIDSEEQEFQAAEKFLQNLLSKTGTGLACLTGPPASGKTVTMQKIVCTHAATILVAACVHTIRQHVCTQSACVHNPDIQMEEDGTSAVLPIPLLPLFMRAAELSKLLSETGKDAADLLEYLCDTGKENMRYLVELFLDKSARQELFPVDFKNCILELFDNDHVLLCIDGLDEAAPYQDLVEDIIDKHVAEKSSDGDVRMLISTREHSYVNSRKLRRLADFDVVKLQPLGKDQQLDMIKGQLIRGEQVEMFLQQLAGIADKNPELATSPFLLSLMIEVYKNDGSIPSQRVKLYAKQVKAIVLRCIATRTNPAAFEVATDYLEILAFVCQVKRSQRDFSLAACADDVEVLWKRTHDDLVLARECLFGTNMVGLLTRVGEDIYRFSHLTLQEYLAATCAVRLFGHDAKELHHHLQPLHSPWKRMVVQFAACWMEDEEVFEGFCQLVLASDDGTGSHCELVQDFLKERGVSEKVEQMVRDKLQEVRGSQGLIAGLCHPSPELRHIVLSEMKKFGVPPDPFAETDGTAAELRQIAEDGASKWHTRAAALLSLVQMAQMHHCRRGYGRSQTLKWLLWMLKPDQNEDIRFALVAGLGTLLKGVERTESKDGIMLVAAEDAPLLLGALEQSANGVVVEAVADLKAYSDRLMDWVSKESSLIAEGVWPMRHLLHVFCIKTATSGNHDRAEKLGQQLFGRVHAMSEDVFEKEQEDVIKGLNMICQTMRDDRLPLILNLLKMGKVKQRSRVMQVAAELGMQFVRKSRESLDTLAQALLSGVDEGCTLADLMKGGSLLAALMSDESNRKHESLWQSPKVFVYLMESLGPTADQGLEAPRRVVNFLVEFEKNRLASAAAAAAAVAAAAAAAAVKGNETKAIEKSQETNPEMNGEEDKKHSEDLSLESLAAAVEDFTPRHLSTLIRQPEKPPEKPLNLYCAARLWATSGLMQERTSEEIAAWLSLSEDMTKEAKDAFSNLRGLKEPWVSGHGCKDGRWLQHVLEGMRDEAQCLGRFMFTTFLEYIRERQCSMKDMSSSGIEETEEQVKEWRPSGARGQLEQQLLLKQVRIGRRSQELPSWTGVVSAPLSMLHEGKTSTEKSLANTESTRRSLGALRHVHANPSLSSAAEVEEHCPHLPPYADVRAVVPGDFLNRNGESYPDGVNYYTIIGRCQGTKKDGRPCDYMGMLQNAYLPLTRFRLANRKIFKCKSWTNPVACRSPGDVVRAARGEVEGQRGWHKFWFAVHHIGAHVGGQQHASQDQLELWTSWLRAKAKDFNSNMKDFQDAGLLVEGGPGDGDAGVRDKFTQAQHVLGIIGGAASIKKVLRKRAPSPGPATVFDEGEFDGRVKQDVKMPQSGQDFSDPRTFLNLVVSPQSLSFPRSGGNGEGVIATYTQTQQFDGGQAFADSFLILDEYDEGGGGGGDGGGGGGGGGQGGLEMFPDQFRPMFLVLLDAMHNVHFSDRADAEREEWAAFDPQEFYTQGGADVQLAQIIGGYLHSNVLQSPTLREFFGALPQYSDALSEQFQRLLTVPRSAAVAGSMSAIYCFWRIQKELLHPMYAEQLPSWYSVKEALLEILTELQQGAPEDEICSGLQGLYDMMNRKVRGPLKDLHANLGKVHASRCSNTG